MTDVFISHSTENAKIAAEICAALESAGLTCWIAPRDIPAGADYREAILTGVSQCGALMILYSEAAGKSETVIAEVSLAREERKPIYPVQIEGPRKIEGPLRLLLQGTQWVDYAKDPAAAIGSVAKQLGAQKTPVVKRRPRKTNLLLFAAAGAGVVVLAIAGYFGYGLWDKHNAIAVCDRAAASEIEIEANSNEAGVVLGMIAPAEALDACARAARLHPRSARMQFNYFRALTAATPAQINVRTGRVKSVLDRAVALGHLQAIVLTNNADEGLPADALNDAITRLTTLAISGNPRASFLLAELDLPMCATDNNGNAPPPSDVERPLVAWVTETLTRANGAGPDPGTLCGEARLLLLGQASAANLAPAMFEIYVDREAQLDTPAASPFEQRTPSELLAATLAQGYKPAALYNVLEDIDCPDGSEEIDSAQPEEWRPLQELAESGYRPAMVAFAGRIVVGCIAGATYPEARRWLERATDGMERDT